MFYTKKCVIIKKYVFLSQKIHLMKFDEILMKFNEIWWNLMKFHKNLVFYNVFWQWNFNEIWWNFNEIWWNLMKFNEILFVDSSPKKIHFLSKNNKDLQILEEI